jgi:hypothetical protein
VIVVEERMKRKKIIENNRRYNKISFIKIGGEKTGREIVRIIEEEEREKFYITEEEIMEVIIENIKEIIGVNDEKIERIIGRIGKETIRRNKEIKEKIKERIIYNKVGRCGITEKIIEKMGEEGIKEMMEEVEGENRWKNKMIIEYMREKIEKS